MKRDSLRWEKKSSSVDDDEGCLTGSSRKLIKRFRSGSRFPRKKTQLNPAQTALKGQETAHNGSKCLKMSQNVSKWLVFGSGSYASGGRDCGSADGTHTAKGT